MTHPRTIAVFGSLLTLLLLPGCPTEEPPDEELDLPAPDVPDDLDNDLTVESFRTWYLIANGLTAGHGVLDLQVTPPSGTEAVDVWIDEDYTGRFEGGDGEQDIPAQILNLAPGEHEVLLASSGADEAFAQLAFIATHPYYVLVTNDWDDADNSDGVMNLQDGLYEDHPELKQTHFVGPYTFTDPAMTEERKQELVDWVTAKRDDHGDEIGLHIHPYCNFVETSSVECRWEPSFAHTEDSSGYTVELSSYSLEETEIMLERAKEIFVERELGTPTSFRAGGWAAQIHTLEALANKGFVADTSANNWARIEEWEGATDASLYEWNAQNWATIDEYSQPYYPSVNDILDDTPPNLDILEVPDNGCLCDYLSGEEIMEMFDANWPGGALEQPAVYVTGYHPSSYGSNHFQMENGLEYISSFLNARDAGPVVYETVSAMQYVFLPE